MKYEKVKTVDIPIKELRQFLFDYAIFRTSRRRCIHPNPKSPNVALSKFFMEEIYDESVDRHRGFAKKLSEQTPFQRWISKDSRFQDSLNKIFNSKLAAFLWEGEEEERLTDIYSFKDEMTWRLQYIYGCGIYAYTYPEKMAEDLSSINLSKKRSFSDKTKKSTKRLLNNLRSDQIPIPDKLEECLTQIIMGDDFGVFSYDAPDVSVNDIQRRRYAIYQICSVSSKNEFLPSNSTKGRFFPTVVMNILNLLGEENLDLRTVELIMAPFDLVRISKLDEESQNILEKGSFAYSTWDNFGMFF